MLLAGGEKHKWGPLKSILNRFNKNKLNKNEIPLIGGLVTSEDIANRLLHKKSNQE